MYNYRIVTYSELHFVEAEVNELIDKGYKPAGGLSVAVNKHGTPTYVQAMIHEEYQGRYKGGR